MVLWGLDFQCIPDFFFFLCYCLWGRQGWPISFVGANSTLLPMVYVAFFLHKLSMIRIVLVWVQYTTHFLREVPMKRVVMFFMYYNICSNRWWSCFFVVKLVVQLCSGWKFWIFYWFPQYIQVGCCLWYQLVLNMKWKIRSCPRNSIKKVIFLRWIFGGVLSMYMKWY